MEQIERGGGRERDGGEGKSAFKKQTVRGFILTERNVRVCVDESVCISVCMRAGKDLNVYIIKGLN